VRRLASASCRVAARSSSRKANVGPEIASARVVSEVSSLWWDKASATEFRRPGWYSTVKSNPNSLLSH
jgi:hypothetical protein